MSNKPNLHKKYGSESPRKVDGQWAQRTQFYREKLRNIIKGMFDVELPEEGWEEDYILNILITEGRVAVTDTSAGVLGLRCSFAGVNYMNRPTTAVFALPFLGSFERTIGEDCEILYLERKVGGNFWTFNEIVRIFAEKLASADAGIDVNLMNARLAYIVEAETKAQSDTIKELFDKVSEGNPLVVYRKDQLSTTAGLNPFFNNVKQNYVADMIQDSKRCIMNEFLTFIGINNANTDKRERLLTQEVESNQQELEANISLWRSNMETCVKKIKKMYPELKFNIELRFDPKKLKEEAENDIVGQRNAVANSQSEQGVSRRN